MKILVIEDDRTIREALKEGLEDESYAVDVEEDGSSGYLAALAEEYDVIILDVMLPEMNGFEVCKKLRSEGISTPILMLTAKTAEEDIIGGLDFGADDYLTKPFSFDVLLARIRALLRRPKEKISEILHVGDLEMNPANKQVFRAGKEIILTNKEFAVLEFLMRNSGQVKSKETIISHCWPFESDVLPNNVELFIMFLRRKIDKPFKTKLIHTVSGFGYKIEEQNEA